MRARRALVATGLIAYLVIGSIGTLYLSGALFVVANKRMPHNITLMSTEHFWEQYSDYPNQRRNLQFAIGASIFLIFVVPLLAVASRNNRPRSLHGDARWARPDEIEKAQLYSRDRGIIIGKYRGRFLIYTGQEFSMLAAATRTGKGVGFVVPNLLNYPDSIVVLDIKLENFKLTSGYRATHGQEVYLWAPFDEKGRTHCLNPLDNISRDPKLSVGDILAIAQSIYPTPPNEPPIWSESARNLFLALTLYLLETPTLPCTLGEVLRQSSGKGKPLKEHLMEIMRARSNGADALSGQCLDAMNRFVSAPDNTLGGILTTFTAPLTIFSNPLVDAATSRSDFQLGDVRRKRMTIYLGIQPNRLSDARLLINLFFSQLIDLNTRELPEHNPDLQYQCALLMDEFTSIGKINNLPSAVGFIAGYNLRLLPIVQSISQLQSVYGDRDTRTLVSNHAVQIVFAPNEQRDANDLSDALGYFTESVRSRSVTYSSGRGGGSSGQNISEQRRALMLPQEVKQLPNDQQIILMRGMSPILCDKIRYYDEPVFKARLLEPIVIDPLDIDLAIAKAEVRIRDLRPDEEVEIAQLVLPALPPLDDPENPSQESIDLMVDAYMGGFQWRTIAEADQGTSTNQAGTSDAGGALIAAA